MKRAIRRWFAGGSVLVLLVTGNAAAWAQARSSVVAILPFHDRGSYGQDKDVFRALQMGIPATIASELKAHPELRLADPNRVQRALRAQGAGSKGPIDAATAARIGKEAGARYAVTGTFADFYGRFRLDARIVDTETGQILKVVSNTDPKLQDRSELYEIIRTVGHKVLSEVGPVVRAAGAEKPAIPTEALTDYSLGLLYETRGDDAKALEHYQRAVRTFPDFAEAREGARRAGRP